jgi:MoaA/NifB/PqqE/SkfB family radical SAM enzyme
MSAHRSPNHRRNADGSRDPDPDSRPGEIDTLRNALLDYAFSDDETADVLAEDLTRAFPFLRYPEIPLPGHAAAGTWLELQGPHSGFFAALEQCLRRLLLAEFDDRLVFIEKMMAFPGIVGEVAALARRVDPVLGEMAAAVAEVIQGHCYPRQLIVIPTFRCTFECPYCFVGESVSAGRADMTLESFRRVVRWAEENGIRTLSFSGGEPTGHADFHTMIHLLAQRGISTYFNTNNTFSEKVLASLTTGVVQTIGIHLPTDYTMAPAQQKRFDRNLDALLAGGIPVFARLNYFLGGESSLLGLIESVRRMGLRRIDLAVTFPDGVGGNTHVPKERLVEALARLEPILNAILSAGLTVNMAKPLPVCLAEGAGLSARLMKHIAPSCTVFRNDFLRNMVIDPDGGIRGCMSLHERGPKLWEFAGFDDVAAALAPKMDRCLFTPLFDGCTDCLLFLARRCQGSCLAYKQGPTP